MLPDLERATVEEAKIRNYLLSLQHDDGKLKAAFFLSFGFHPDRWEIFALSLREQAKSGVLTKTVQFLYGSRYVIEGDLPTPDGRNPLIRTVWIVETPGDAPRLVTAYPL